MKPLHRSKRKYGRPTIAAQAKANLGTPVCVVLKDGSYYYGVLKEVQTNQVILQGFKGNKKPSKKRNKSKAHISGLGGLLGLLGGGGLGGLLGGGTTGGLLGGGLGLGSGSASAAKPAGGGGFFSNIGSFMKVGMGVIKFIMPLMKNFSF
ncbi:hypothetical protein [Paenibacillus planticolens]|uniref:Uncharacterized protein n=1 Tax=Paenibacillus planticolens TaxID=2654976 RepID=A0ABX1ZTL3_9BACL|nr:hypothetical protein [Paenibacillus planticolens]NOV02272.1 hypothetical protein [Paenibacillus planticolens]